MYRSSLFVLIAASTALVACSSDMNSGMSAPGGITPPVQPGAQPGTIGIGATARPSGALAVVVTPTPSPPPGNSATYAFSDAVNGIRCPQLNGYSCIIHLNVPPATPTPNPRATPSPSPTPSPSGSPSASPSPTPAVSMALEAQPHDVPSMVSAQSDLDATALMALRLSVTRDVTLTGTASADFIIPPAQLPGRIFAVQLYRETVRRGRRTDSFLGSYGKSALVNGALRFAITPPQVTIKHGETWLLVLYANEKPLATASPAPKTSVSSSPAPSPTPSASPSPSGSQR